jgi:hypothetical protein
MTVIERSPSIEGRRGNPRRLLGSARNDKKHDNVSELRHVGSG